MTVVRMNSGRALRQQPRPWSTPGLRSERGRMYRTASLRALRLLVSRAPERSGPPQVLLMGLSERLAEAVVPGRVRRMQTLRPRVLPSRQRAAGVLRAGVHGRWQARHQSGNHAVRGPAVGRLLCELRSLREADAGTTEQAQGRARQVLLKVVRSARQAAHPRQQDRHGRHRRVGNWHVGAVGAGVPNRAVLDRPGASATSDSRRARRRVLALSAERSPQRRHQNLVLVEPGMASGARRHGEGGHAWIGRQQDRGRTEKGAG